MLLNVVIPVYNEQSVIQSTLKRISGYLQSKGWPAEIIVVNDGSTDDTVKELSKLSLENLKIISHSKNLGKGASVKSGMLAAKGDLLLFTDADNSTDISEIDKFIEKAMAGYDIVIASRTASASKIVVHQPSWKELLGKLGNYFVRLISGLKFKDTQCGFKLFKKDCLFLFKEQRNKHWAFDVEILLKAKKHNLKVAEMPIVWKNNFDSKFTLKYYFKFFFELIKIRLEDK